MNQGEHLCPSSEIAFELSQQMKAEFKAKVTVPMLETWKFGGAEHLEKEKGDM